MYYEEATELGLNRLHWRGYLRDTLRRIPLRRGGLNRLHWRGYLRDPLSVCLDRPYFVLIAYIGGVICGARCIALHLTH